MSNYPQRAAAVKRNLSAGVRLPQPLAKYWYFDKIRIWLRRRLPEWRIDWLREHCRGGLRDDDERRKLWDPRYVLCLEMYQPDDEALQYLATLDGVLLNYAECALDLVFNNKQEADAANELIRRYHIKRRHGAQLVLFCRGITRYSGPRWAANMLVVYADKECRITGEVYCLHLEWRLNGVQALQRAGLGTVSQLLELDHHRFWKKRLLLRTVDYRALGRMYRVRIRGNNRGRGRPWDSRIGYSVLGTVGSAAAGTRGTVQALVDKYRRRFDIGRCLVPLPVDNFLPNVAGRDDDSRRSTRSEIYVEEQEAAGKNVGL